MKDRLKDFINDNRENMDTLSPSSDLWTKIDTQISSTPSAGFTSSKVWWKILSLVVVTGSILTYLNFNQPENSNSTIALIPSIMVLEEDTLDELNDIPEPVIIQPKVSEKIIISESEAPKLADFTPPIIELIKEDELKLEEVVSEKHIDSPIESNIGPIDTTKVDFSTKSFENIKSVIVNAIFCEVVFLPHTQSSLILESRISKKTKKEDGYEITSEVTGSILEINVEIKDKKCRPCRATSDHDQLKIYFPEGLSSVNIKTTSGSSEINGYQGENLDLSSTSGNIEAYDIVAKTNINCTSGDIDVFNLDGDLSTQSTSGSKKVKNLSGNLNTRSTSGDLIAKEINGSVKAESTSGTMFLNNLNGPVNIKSTSGDIEIMKNNGDIEITSFSGNQIINDNVGNIHSNCTSGDFTLERITGHVVSKSFSGFQYFSQVTGDIKCSTKSGDVQVQKTQGSLFAETFSGSITGKEVSLEKFTKLKTISGDIDLVVDNNYESVSFDLKSTIGDLYIHMDQEKINAKKILTSGSGNIKISGTTSTGNQSFKN